MATDSECKKKIKIDIIKYGVSVIKKSGCAVYVQFAMAFNNVIAVARATVQSYLNLVRPLFLLDDLVLNTFVLPPMNAAISAAESMQKEVTGPINQIGASANKCPDTASVSRSLEVIRKKKTFDVSGLQNKRDALVEWMEEDSALQKGLDKAIEVFDDLSDVLPASCDEFKSRYSEFFTEE